MIAALYMVGPFPRKQRNVLGADWVPGMERRAVPPGNPPPLPCCFSGCQDRPFRGKTTRGTCFRRGLKIGGTTVDYGYMQWPMPTAAGTIREGAFQAYGIFGQHLYVNPRENVVIVVWSALPKPTGKASVNDAALFAAVAQALCSQDKPE